MRIVRYMMCGLVCLTVMLSLLAAAPAVSHACEDGGKFILVKNPFTGKTERFNKNMTEDEINADMLKRHYRTVAKDGWGAVNETGLSGFSATNYRVFLNGGN